MLIYKCDKVKMLDEYKQVRERLYNIYQQVNPVNPCVLILVQAEKPNSKNLHMFVGLCHF